MDLWDKTYIFNFMLCLQMRSKRFADELKLFVAEIASEFSIHTNEFSLLFGEVVLGGRRSKDVIIHYFSTNALQFSVKMIKIP